MPGHVARLVPTQITDPPALLKPFPVLPQGMSTRLRGWGLWPIRAKGPEGAPLILPRKAGAQRGSNLPKVTHC